MKGQNPGHAHYNEQWSKSPLLDTPCTYVECVREDEVGSESKVCNSCPGVNRIIDKPFGMMEVAVLGQIQFSGSAIDMGICKRSSARER